MANSCNINILYEFIFSLCDVIFWFFSAASYSFFQITKASDEPYYFSKAIKDNLKIIVVIQFVLSVYTFSLWVELIFIPLMVVIGGMIAVSQQKEEHKIVEQLLTKLTEAIGLFIVIFTVYKLITAFGELGQLKTIYDLIIPTALSLLLLPFLYLLAVFNNYQSIFVRLGLFIKDPQLLKYAKLTSIRKCHLRFAKLVRWANNVACLDIKSKADYIVMLYWEPESVHDIDIWMTDPAGNVLSFKNKTVGLMHLDRDDFKRRLIFEALVAPCLI